VQRYACIDGTAHHRGEVTLHVEMRLDDGRGEIRQRNLDLVRLSGWLLTQHERSQLSFVVDQLGELRIDSSRLRLAMKDAIDELIEHAKTLQASSV
jgi:hypothetical protein